MSNKLDEIMEFDQVEDAEVIEEESNESKELVTADTRKPPRLSKEEVEDKCLENDFEFARTNIRTMIEDGTQAVAELIQVAQDSQHPRAYEALSTMFKNMVDANKTYIELRKTKAEVKEAANIKDKEQPKEGDKIQNNIVFNGSTKELLEFMRDKDE